MSSTSIAIKLRNDNEENKKTLWNKITSTLTNNEILVSKLIPNGYGFTAILSSINDADKLLQSKCLAELRNINVEAQMTPELKAQRTILASNVDGFVYEKSENELKRSLIAENGKIESVHKLPRYNSFKITYDSIANATKVLQQGLRICNISIPTTSLKRDRYVNVTFCYKCYAMDGHTIKNCNKPPHFKVCSTCSDTTHTYRDCTAPVDKYKCVNCNGNHKTTSFACKERKEKAAAIIRGLSGNSTSIPPQSYATITSRNIQPDKTQITKTDNAKNTIPASTLPSEDKQLMKDITNQVSTTITCLILAQLKSNGSPANFDALFQKLLSLNNVNKFSLGDIEPPKLFDTITLQSTTMQDASSHQNTTLQEASSHQNALIPAAPSNDLSSKGNPGSPAATTHKNITPEDKSEFTPTCMQNTTSSTNDSVTEIYKTPPSARTTASSHFVDDVSKFQENTLNDKTAISINTNTKKRNNRMPQIQKETVNVIASPASSTRAKTKRNVCNLEVH